MFGYVVPNQKELKAGQLEEYRAWYCGLCRCLQKKYGVTGRLSLNYDMTFLGMLLSSLYEPEITRQEGNCIAHPFTRQGSYSDIYLEYAADMNILLTYYKCRDDWVDDHNFWKAGYGALLHGAGKKISGKYPQKAQKIQGCLERLTLAENQKSDNLDEVAGLFGEICGCLFVCQEDEWKEFLQRLGFFLGKFIYLMDAWEDWEEDQKKQNYNPLFSSGIFKSDGTGYAGPEFCITEELEQRVYEILTMMIAEACRAFERLPIIKNVEILRNIMYSGVWCRYYQIKEKSNRVKKTKRT